MYPAALCEARNMEPAQPDANPGGDTVKQAIRPRRRSLNSGNYGATSKSILDQFADWLREERDVRLLEDVDVLDCRRYAQHLRDRVNDPDDDLSAASAHENGPYYTVVRAFFSWCVDDERADANPARPKRVRDELPEYHDDPDRQFWTPEARRDLLGYVGQLAEASIDSDEATHQERVMAYRDRALAAMLAFSGVRGAEVLRDPKDRHRPGLTWSDLDLEEGRVEVFGKTREYQTVPLTDRVCQYLDRLQRVMDPPSASWPVFPTAHAPSLRSALDDRLDEDELQELLEDRTSWEVCLEADVEPPALTKNGGRSVMKRICEAADVSVDGEYLKPHGGRRLLGDELYESSATLSQETLRHQSIETTHDSYRDRHVDEQRRQIEDVLGDAVDEGEEDDEVPETYR